MKITRILWHSVYILPGFSWSSNLPHEQTDQTWAKNLSSTFFDINSIFVYTQLSKIFCKIYITLWNPQIPSTVSYLGRLPCSFGDTSLWQSSHNFWSAEFSDLPASAIISRHCLLTSITSELAQFIYVSIWNCNREFFNNMLYVVVTSHLAFLTNAPFWWASTNSSRAQASTGMPTSKMWGSCEQ